MQLTDLKIELLKVINEHNNLPIDGIYYVIKDIYEIATNELNKIYEQEQQEKYNKLAEESKEGMQKAAETAINIDTEKDSAADNKEEVKEEN